MTLALIDYGAANLRSVKKALEAVGAEVVQTDNAKVILHAKKVVLPGVGAFQDGMAGLQKRGLILTIKKLVSQGTPILGICLGMQLFFEKSMEMGSCEGLGFIRGTVRPFSTKFLKVPQTGWNQLELQNNSPLLKNIQQDNYVYFNHSYYCEPTKTNSIIAKTNYEILYASAVQCDSLYGVQFHPEKSQQVGLTILKNFLEECQ